MQDRTPSRFLLASTVFCAVACAGVAMLPLAVGSAPAFAGSVGSSGLLGLVFAARNLQLLRAAGEPSLPPAVLTTVFGGWFMLAPLLYPEVGFLPTAGTQLGGTVMATFGLYVVVAGLSGE
ncbi:MAG: hypothetical protein R6U01_08490 [Halorubrum sp.]|uniref:hypothetical protein n=1 Tax=Halorubrum sp. TaxID=1879286 RepID=UPI00397069BE